MVDLVDPVQVHGELEIPVGPPTDSTWRPAFIGGSGEYSGRVSIFDVLTPEIRPWLIVSSSVNPVNIHGVKQTGMKAAGYFPEEDVLLVPYETWDWDWDTGRNSYNTAIQKIEIVGDDLRKAGQVSHEVRAQSHDAG